MKYLKLLLAVLLAAIFVNYNGMGSEYFSLQAFIGTYKEVLVVGVISYLLMPALTEELV